MPRTLPSSLTALAGTGGMTTAAPDDPMTRVAAVGAGTAMLIAVALLVAVAILRARNQVRARRWATVEERWQPRLLDLAAGATEPSALYPDLRPWETRYVVALCVRFARLLEGDDRRRLATFAAPLLSSTLPQLEARAPERRARAVQTLSILGFDAHLARIVAALDDPAPLVAMVAARAIARERRADLLPAILFRLHRFLLWNRAFLSSMLASIGPPAASPLRAFLADDTEPPRGRAVAADALRLLHDPVAPDIAARILVSGEDDRELAAACLRLLAASGRPTHADAARRYVDHPDFVLRALAVTALGEIGDERDLLCLQRALHDRSRWVALHAARALHEAGHRTILTAVARSGHPHADLAREVLEEAA